MEGSLSHTQHPTEQVFLQLGLGLGHHATWADADILSRLQIMNIQIQLFLNLR